jgi:hypothetical protein
MSRFDRPITLFGSSNATGNAEQTRGEGDGARCIAADADSTALGRELVHEVASLRERLRRVFHAGQEPATNLHRARAKCRGVRAACLVRAREHASLRALELFRHTRRDMTGRTT